MPETLAPGSLFSYDRDVARQSFTCAQHTDSEREEFGTRMNGGSVLAATVATCKRIGSKTLGEHMSRLLLVITDGAARRSFGNNESEC